MRRMNAFTIVELLVVLAIIAVLAALLFPVYARAIEGGRRTTCISNLHQLGSAVAMYAADYDDRIPYAIDEAERAALDVEVTDFDLNVINEMPSFAFAIRSYVRSTGVFKCPSEHPFDYYVDPGMTYFGKFGSSYHYAIFPAYLMYSIEDFVNPADQYLMADVYPWHGGTWAGDFRINELFADFHAKSVTNPYYLGSVVPDSINPDSFN